MTAVVRIKRPLNEDPLDALILNCKRRKLESKSESIEDGLQLSSTVLKFAGTLQKEDDILPHLKTKYLDGVEELKTKFKKHVVSLNEKLRNEHQDNSKSNRFKIVNRFRSSINLSETPDTSESKYEITVLDVETDINKNEASEADQNVQQSKYVYDLYYTCSDDFPEIEDYHSVQHLMEFLPAGSSVDTGVLDSDQDSEDSNAECNWKNDYPDESDMESVDEKDMVEAMENMGMENDLLSSDDGDDFVYCHDDSENDCSGSETEPDVHLYGERYARFKAKHLKGDGKPMVNNGLYFGDIEDDEHSE
ncbi:unnamed protein product [Phaedon cochleariae]|uniref:Probable RNA polymerase II nuclear localization protein SLC7A6OS n=1 Tax=Phaedon cochleariae TaxID=80249 RepID=A0A9N9SMA7_PHACE|nr:unnamed protein product [Phaedon cochleariae]